MTEQPIVSAEALVQELNEHRPTRMARLEAAARIVEADLAAHPAQSPDDRDLALAGLRGWINDQVDATDDAGAIAVKPSTLWGPGPEGRTLANLATDGAGADEMASAVEDLLDKRPNLGAIEVKLTQGIHQFVEVPQRLDRSGTQVRNVCRLGNRIQNGLA
jgi:hypothetical protein